jgi:hypothetical protein
MPTPTNPYYQRAFNALAGTLARARQVLNEFVLIQRGFDLIGNVSNAAKYQLSCSDLDTALTVKNDVNYFHVQRAFTALEARASLLTPSTSGAVTITMTVDGVALFSTPLTIDANETSSTTAAVPHVLAITDIPDNARIRINITGAGTGAKGLICSVLGRINVPIPPLPL